MQENLVTSRVDPLDGFTLHDTEIGIFINDENLRRCQENRPLISQVLKIPGAGPRPGYISTILVFE
ncbi:MAG: hypothetical protein JWM39_767 [Parcubacteria group bacterium]|nr:hypothetical protein [Parcubacteria group bacterium]